MGVGRSDTYCIVSGAADLFRAGIHTRSQSQNPKGREGWGGCQTDRPRWNCMRGMKLKLPENGGPRRGCGPHQIRPGGAVPYPAY
eukprot:767419-Hanusia_phi.AAC.1